MVEVDGDFRPEKLRGHPERWTWTSREVRLVMREASSGDDDYGRATGTVGFRIKLFIQVVHVLFCSPRTKPVKKLQSKIIFEKY